MARIRSIKPEFFTSEQVAECSPNARLLFVGMWCFCDDNGVHPASTARLKMEVFPADDFTREDIGKMVAELVAVGLLREYEADSQHFWMVTGWKHQKIDKPNNKYPLPVGEQSSNSRRKVVEQSPTTPLPVGEQSPPEGKGEEGKGEKHISSSATPADSATATPSPADIAAKRQERLSVVTNEAIEAYNRILAKPSGLLAAVKPSVGLETRREQVRRCLKTAGEICAEQFGDSRVTPEFWQAYFETAADDDFHAGRGPYSGGHANWRPDFEFLTRKATMLKLFERAIGDDAEAA